MTTTMTLEAKSLDTPDETRPYEKGRVDVVTVCGLMVERGTFQPGWRWSEHVKPTTGTEHCQTPHVGYIISGRMRVLTEDGSERQLGPGDAFVVPPGHDAWVVGDEACVALDFTAVEW